MDRTTAGVHSSLFQLNPFEQVSAWLLVAEVLTEELDQGLLQHAWPLLLQGLQRKLNTPLTTTKTHTEHNAQSGIGRESIL